MLIVSALLVFVLFSAVAVYMKLKTGMTYDFGFSLFARHSIFYLSGLLVREHFETVKNWLLRWWWSFIPIWFVLATFWHFDHKPTFVSNPNLIVEMMYYYLTAFAGILMMMSLGLKFIKQDDVSVIVRAGTYLGQKTFGIYAIHLSFLMTWLCDVLAPYNLSNWIYVFSVFVLAVMISLVLIRIIENCKLLPQLMLGKVKLT